MAVATFDTLKFANALKAAGMPDKQAEAQAVAVAEVIQVNLKDLVTKDDLKAAVQAMTETIRHDIKESSLRLENQLKESVQRLENQIAGVRHELKETDQRFDNRNKETEQRIGNRIGGVRHELKEAEQRAGNRIDVQKVDLTFLKWFTGVLIVGVLMTVVRLYLLRGQF